jgi:catechol 2,3-dioxygenase-like lactoylglutathione lyase family enzyme
MHIASVTHVAFRVPDLQAAESFYCNLFGLDIAWREVDTADGSRTVPDGATWDDMTRAGVQPDIIMLYREGFVIALEPADTLQPHGVLSHLGILVDQNTLQKLHTKALELNCQIIFARERTIMFDDPFGVRWEPTVTPYINPRQFSSGAQEGAWLQLE